MSKIITTLLLAAAMVAIGWHATRAPALKRAPDILRWHRAIERQTEIALPPVVEQAPVVLDQPAPPPPPPALPPKPKPKPKPKVLKPKKPKAEIEPMGGITCAMVRHWIAGKSREELEALRREHHVTDADIAKYAPCLKS